MSIEVRSIFISSTSDLTEERETAWEVIRQHRMEREVLPYISDYDLRPGETPEKRIQAEIKNADLFLMILGGRYGSLYTEAKKQPSPSICEWEFDIAQKRRLQMLSLEKVMPGETIDEPQRHFRDRVRQFHHGTWKYSFSSKEEFAKAFSTVLMSWRASDTKIGRTLEKFSFLALLTSCSIQLLAFPWLDNNVSRDHAVGIYITTSGVAIGFGLNILFRILRR